MEEQSLKSSETAAADATMDAPVQEESGTDSSIELSPARDQCGCVELIEGSGPELSAETACLLRGRLRLAGTLMFIGFAAFLAKNFITPPESFNHGLLALHVLVTAGLGALAGTLFLRHPISLGLLRVIEVVMFGLPLLFFLVVQYYATTTCCKHGYFLFPAGLWLMLIFAYALFIPNSIRRAAVVIGVLALAPVVMLLWMLWSSADLLALADANVVTGFILMLVLAAVAGVFGVDTIGSLRREAQQARELGQYRLTRRIGVGGMGEVYLAEHQLLKRPCVVKLIRPDKAGNPKLLARFQREVRATAKLTHWNTVEIFDYGSTEDGTFYYVMEYLPGMSLAELVERFGPMPAERVIYLLDQACDALAEAHAVGLVHRDIKPANIFAARLGGVYDVVKLLDFGLVKPMISEEEQIQLTADGSITGSPLYMSPEQALGETKPCPRSDIYSLGAVGYYLLTGRPPFDGQRPIKVLIAHAHDEVVPPSQHRPEIPADLEQVILRCLAKKPADRFTDAAALQQALGGCEAAGRWDRGEAAAWWQQQDVELTV